MPAGERDRAATDLIPRVPVRVAGLLAGDDVDALAELCLGETAIEFRAVRAPAQTAAGAVTAAGEPSAVASPARDIEDIPLAAIDGVRHRGDELALFLAGGDVLEVTALEPGARTLGRIGHELEMRACAFSDPMLPLRGFGSRRARPDAEHNRFFAPLLGARRRAEHAEDADARLAAFDAAPLRTALHASLDAFARSRYAGSAPDARALSAELAELFEPLGARLDELAGQARAARAAADDARFVALRAWVGSVRALFAGADRCWLAVVTALREAPPAPRHSWWRRVLRRHAATEHRGGGWGGGGGGART